MKDFSIGGSDMDYGILELSSKEIDLVSGGEKKEPSGIKKLIKKILGPVGRIISAIEVAAEAWKNRQKIKEQARELGDYLQENPLPRPPYY